MKCFGDNGVKEMEKDIIKVINNDVGDDRYG